jgi:hypothetical protein
VRARAPRDTSGATHGFAPKLWNTVQDFICKRSTSFSPKGFGYIDGQSMINAELLYPNIIQTTRKVHSCLYYKVSSGKFEPQYLALDPPFKFSLQTQQTLCFSHHALTSTVLTSSSNPTSANPLVLSHNVRSSRMIGVYVRIMW